MASDRGRLGTRVLCLALVVVVVLCGAASASVGDRLPEFKQCLEVTVARLSPRRDREG